MAHFLPSIELTGRRPVEVLYIAKLQVLESKKMRYALSRMKNYPFVRSQSVRIGATILMSAVLAACGSDSSDDWVDAPVLNPNRAPLAIQETSVTDFRTLMSKGEASCHDLVDGYLKRIEAYDRQGPELNSVILVNPNALAEAQALDDAYFMSGELKGPMHCVPVLVKDNIDTGDMPTTAGSLALANNQPEDDAFIMKKVKDAGGIILAKVNLDEFAFGFGGASAVGGQVKNAYILENSPGGSSSGTGTAVAASFGMVGIGTDTGGSIRVPSAVEGLFGLRPTLRLVSQDGIVPLAHGQDTAGPLCRKVEDCALLLDAMAGFDASAASGQRTDKAYDAPLVADATAYAQMTGYNGANTYTSALNTDALKGARIGVVRAMFPQQTQANAEFLATLEAALEKMKAAGAIVEDVEIADNAVVIGAEVADIPGNPGRFASLSSFEFANDLTAYLTSWSSDIDKHWRSTEDVAAALIAFPQETKVLGSFNFYLQKGQALSDPTSDVYKDYQRNLKPRDAYVISRVSAALDNHDFATGQRLGEAYDVLLYPVLQGFNGPSVNAGSNNRLSPFSGFPALAFPAGFATAPTGAGLEEPVAFEMLGRPFADGQMLSLAYSWQQVAQPRQAPTTVPEL